MAGLRRKLALRTAALLLAVRWYNIAFLTVAQGVFLWKLVQHNGAIWGPSGGLPAAALLMGINALLVSGGSLINNFYDAEQDLIHRPWRTLFERTVVRKYGIPLAFAFWFFGLGLAWRLGIRMGVFFAGYAVLLWVYSHKRQSLQRGAHAVAAGLAFLPFLSCSLWLRTLPWNLLVYGLVLLLIETARQAAKAAQTDPEVRGYRESLALLFFAAAAAVMYGAWWGQPGLILIGFPAGIAVAFLRILDRISYANGIHEPVKAQHARNLDAFLKIYMVFSLAALIFAL